MSRLSLKMKLAVGFGGLLLILTVLGVVGYESAVTSAELSQHVERQVTTTRLSLAIDLSIEKQVASVRGFLLMGTDARLKADQDSQRTFQASMEELGQSLDTDEGKRTFAGMKTVYSEYRSIMDEAIRLRRANKTKEAVRLIFSPAAQSGRDELRNDTTKVVQLAQELKKAAQNEQSASAAKTKSLMLLLAGLGLLIGLAVAILMARSITLAIARMVDLIQELAADNLAAADMQITSQDEIGKAGTALNGMKNNLRALIQSIAGTAEHVASASEEISSSATQQAQAAETQTDQTTQVANAMQQMSATVMQVSENSNKAAEASRQAAETARHGGTIVEDTLTKMRTIADSVSATARKMAELGKSSDQIGRIIGVIDDIADQTNLLALNAAIEAARAGEQGRGFAVVADEVRKLAERTTTATKEIAEMIKSIQDETKSAVSAMEAGNQQAEDGVRSTTQAGDSLREIIQMSEQVGEMITHIATAATEQSSATEQVNGNVEQISKLVKESAVGAQQSAKACQDLSGLALDLQTMVSRFKLDQANRGRPEHGSKDVPIDAEVTPKVFSATAG
jgi:methyl-accepting chemotaxis protein